MDWCDFATRDDKGANAGGAFTGGPPRGVLHTTEGSTFRGARAAYEQANSWPHFTITNESATVAIYQHLPISSAARSLEHRNGTVETNRQTAIQIEIVGYAAKSAGFPASYLDGIAKLMRWIEANGQVAKSSGVAFVTPGDEIRLSDAEWIAYNGWCGHQHVPNNAHEDPGPIPVSYLLGSTTTLQSSVCLLPINAPVGDMQSLSKMNAEFERLLKSSLSAISELTEKSISSDAPRLLFPDGIQLVYGKISVGDVTKPLILIEVEISGNKGPK